MARKNRLIEQTAAAATEPKEKVVYQDAFQKNVNRRLDDAGRKFEGKGKNLLYALGALAVLGLLFVIFYSWNSRSGAAGQTALGKAIETSQAPISDTSAPAGSTTGRTFKTTQSTLR